MFQINPIGSISKVDLRRFILWAKTAFDVPALQDFLDATPSAELIPITNGSEQSDEVEMGMTYEELSIFGRLRKARLSSQFRAVLTFDRRKTWAPTACSASSFRSGRTR